MKSRTAVAAAALGVSLLVAGGSRLAFELGPERAKRALQTPPRPEELEAAQIRQTTMAVIAGEFLLAYQRSPSRMVSGHGDFANTVQLDYRLDQSYGALRRIRTFSMEIGIGSNGLPDLGDVQHIYFRDRRLDGSRPGAEWQTSTVFIGENGAQISHRPDAMQNGPLSQVDEAQAASYLALLAARELFSGAELAGSEPVERVQI